MPKYELITNAGDYAPVADRITLFYKRFPSGRILTRLVSRTEREITVQAYVFRSTAERSPAATGLASERIGDGDINTVACLENTETSAVGRALANLGLTASPNRPSREEIEKANRERGRRVAEPVPPSPSYAARRASLTSHAPSPASIAMQRRADRVMDALDLLSQAERGGLPPRRGRFLQHTLTSPTASMAAVERIERLLRAWIATREARHLRL
ncbi:MAG TPA: hypothetical protein VM076_00880 [Gemmatimonadaceae bacterium]|nr:hypothetical protein [Gemmatimonadaceae bacterium]